MLPTCIMTERPANAEKVEIIKVWYSVFCTLMDGDEYTDAELLSKLRQLREELKKAVPEVEAEMGRYHQ